MRHTDLLKRAFTIAWRYRALWLFGFLLALCSGGSGGGGNFNFPSGGAEEFDLPFQTAPEVDPQLLLAIIGGIVCLVLLLAVVGVVVTTVSRTALIGMVDQIVATDQATVRDGWRLGWSREAWRLFLVGLVIGIPVAIVSLILIALAMSPLLLLLAEDSALMVLAIVLTILAVLLVVVLLLVIGALITPLRELAWRRTVLDERPVLESVSQTFQLIKQNLKDVAIIWLLMVGVGILWAIVAFIVVLPTALIAALFVGGIPAGLVYLFSESWLGAAVTGLPLALLALMLVTSFATGLYLTFQSAVWTLAHLELTNPRVEVVESPDSPDDELDMTMLSSGARP